MTQHTVNPIVEEIVRNALTDQFFIAALQAGHGPRGNQPVGEWVTNTTAEAYAALGKIFQASKAGGCEEHKEPQQEAEVTWPTGNRVAIFNQVGDLVWESRRSAKQAS